ncbi:MAG TPA: gluconeogenesis factor YvcK family protein [Patescibacteria group bacterium]|nr:gluconeogenesis factor YvcK family protein [Patescibacteria group bacterium]
MRKKIVTIGGGSGHCELLRGLRDLDIDLTAVVSTMDNGGPNGVLRDEYGVVPPSDLRKCLSALIPNNDSQANRWWSYRFSSGTLDQYTVGNILLTALTKEYGSVHCALDRIRKLFHIQAHVLPVSEQFADLVAVLEDGTKIVGETNIDIPQHNASLHIRSLSLSSPVEVTPQVREAIHAADLIVLSFGDLYTSVIANLCVTGVSQAIYESKAQVVYVCNRSTKKGETHNFTTNDFYRELNHYLAPAKVHTMIVDTGSIPVPSFAQAVAVAPIEDGQMMSINLADEKKPEKVSGKKAAKIIYSLCTSL